jgi:rod shape-determining protein MreC
MRASNAVYEYLALKNVNADLAQENARLNNLYTKVQQGSYEGSKGNGPDSMVAGRFRYRVAKVINNSTRNFNNYLTLDKGTLDGIKPGMGVISPAGVVGKVKYCSDHFSTVTSLLHLDLQVSSQIKKDNTIGTAKWDGKDAGEISLLYVPHHIQLTKGDTIVTSSYNTIFPEGIMIGTIKDFNLREAEAFYDIDVVLSTDFYKLTYVYVIENVLQAEQESLEQRTTLGSK